MLTDTGNAGSKAAPNYNITYYMEKTFLSIEEVAALLSVSPATVNYYTNTGLFRVNERKGNKRLYNKKEILMRFDKIRGLRKEGYSLALIREKHLNAF